MILTTLSEKEIIATLLALAMLLASAYIFGNFFEKIKAPRVVGEIVGGMFWGASCLHFFFPEFVAGIFMAYEQEGKVLSIFYQLGLIFLMFLSGFNTNLRVNRENAKVMSCVFVGATVLPMVGGIPFIGVFQNHFIGTKGNEVSFALVFVIAIAITSIPVISKIFFDMGIMNTKFSDTVLTVSTFQDLCLWILLNAATRIASTGEVKLLDMIVVVALTLGMFVVVKLVSDKIEGIKRDIGAIEFYSTSIVVVLLVCALLYMVGINIMYSAFLVGYVVKAFTRLEKKTTERMQVLGDFSFSFFIPIYFALVGIQLNVLHNFSLVRFLIFFVLAFGLEAFGTLLMLQFTKVSRATKINFAITMNARGGPGIVLATVAYSYEIINIEFFTVLILTTMLSSLIAGYWLRRQQKIDADVFMDFEKNRL